MVSQPLKQIPSECTDESGSASNKRGLGIVVFGVLLLAAWALGLAGSIPRFVALAAALAIGVGALVFGLKTRWLDGEISARIARLGGPVILAMLSQTAVNVID